MTLLFEANGLRLLLALFSAAAVIAQSPQREPAASLAIRDVTVVATAAAQFSGPVTLIIRGDRIAAIGPTDQVPIPPATRIVEGAGRFLMPGLIDMHTHLGPADIGGYRRDRPVSAG